MNEPKPRVRPLQLVPVEELEAASRRHVERCGPKPFAATDPWGPGTFAVPAGTLLEVVTLRLRPLPEPPEAA